MTLCYFTAEDGSQCRHYWYREC